MALRNDLKIGLAIGGLAVFLLVLVLYLAFTQPPKAGVATAGDAGGASALSSAEKPAPTASGTGGAAKPEDNLTGQIVIPENINPNPAKPNNPGVATAEPRNPIAPLPPLIGSEITPKPNPTQEARQEENTWLQRYGDGPTPPDVTQTPGPAAPNRTFANPDGTPAVGPARTAGSNFGGAPTDSNASTPSAGKTYAVQEGDTLTGIAQKVYGRTGAYVAIAAANPGVDPARMRVGTTLTLPDASTARTESPAPLPVATGPNQHRVEQGETLSSIAKQSLGSEARWEQLYDLNRDQIGSDPGALKLGMVLKLPQ